MDVKEYLQNPCGTLSIPYWKAKTLAIPDSMRIIHCRAKELGMDSMAIFKDSSG